MRDFVRPTDSTSIVALVARNQVAGIPLIPRITNTTMNQVGVPQVIRYAIRSGTMRASVELVPVERPRRLPHRRTQPVPRALRLLAELVEGPAVRAARRTFKSFAREALEERVTDTVSCGSIAVAPIGTL